MPLKKKKSKALISIYLSAKDLFWKKGIYKTTVEEICTKAGVSKMTFYRHYTNKEDIALELLMDSSKQRVDDYKKIFQMDLPFDEKINLTTQSTLKQTQNISAELLLDIYHVYPKLNKNVIEGRKELYEVIASNFKKYQEEFQPEKVYSSQIIIQIIDMVYVKLRDPNFIKLFSTTQDAVVEINKIMFFGIMGCPKDRL